MFGARHYWCATASLLAQLAFAGAAQGGDSTNTVLVSSSPSDARLTRALVLIRGELSALGLDVRVTDGGDAPPGFSETTSERLSLDVKDGVVVVRVFAAGGQVALVESVDVDGPEVTAEVIAVRAVEALRAARLLPAQPTRLVAPKPPPPPSSAEPPASRTPAVVPNVAALATPIPTVLLSLGPILVQNGRGSPQVGARAAVLVGPRWGFVAVGAEASLAEPDFESKAGSGHASRRALLLQLGTRVRFHRAWELSARAGVSYIHYAASGVAQPGYQAQDLEHGTGAASLSFGGAHYFARAFGIYLDLSGILAFDAARIRLDEADVVTLDRPSLALGAGVLLGFF
jgi:hypothetical protein